MINKNELIIKQRFIPPHPTPLGYGNQAMEHGTVSVLYVKEKGICGHVGESNGACSHKTVKIRLTKYLFLYRYVVDM